MAARATALVWALAAVNIGFAALLVWSCYAARGAAGTPDFMAFWAAGRLTLEGTPALAYDWEAHRAVETAGLGRDWQGWMPWHYPPWVQLIVAPFAALPLWPAMAAWTGLTLALYLRTCWLILPGALGLGAALAAAPTAMMLVNGQSGFLIAALLGLGLLMLERRPAGAGILLAGLAIKPHLALGLPVALAAAGRWRAFAAAAAGVAALVALTLAVLGPETLAAFRASLTETTRVYAGDGGAVQRWHAGANLYALLSRAGVPFGPALALQGAVSLAALGLLAHAWRRGPAPALAAALVCFATAAAAPRLLNYDLHLLVIGGLFQLRHARAAGHFRGEGAVLIAALLAAFASMLWPPGLAWALAPVLLAACWLGHARDSYRRVTPDSAPVNRPNVPSGTSRD